MSESKKRSLEEIADSLDASDVPKMQRLLGERATSLRLDPEKRLIGEMVGKHGCWLSPWEFGGLLGVDRARMVVDAKESGYDPDGEDMKLLYLMPRSHYKPDHWMQSVPKFIADYLFDRKFPLKEMEFYDTSNRLERGDWDDPITRVSQYSLHLYFQSTSGQMDSDNFSDNDFLCILREKTTCESHLEQFGCGATVSKMDWGFVSHKLTVQLIFDRRGDEIEITGIRSLSKALGSVLSSEVQNYVLGDDFPRCLLSVPGGLSYVGTDSSCEASTGHTSDADIDSTCETSTDHTSDADTDSTCEADIYLWFKNVDVYQQMLAAISVEPVLNCFDIQ